MTYPHAYSDYIYMLRHYGKYNNRKTVVDGITFDSCREANRYIELKTLQKAGFISNLKLQQKFLIVPKEGNNSRARFYIADFTYTENGVEVIEDVKSEITRKNPVYTLKKALMLYLYPSYVFRETE